MISHLSRYFLIGISVLVSSLGFSRSLQAVIPKRIVSYTVGADDLLLTLADDDQIAALSPYAHQPHFSPLHQKAHRFPSVQKGNSESILQYKPDLVMMTLDASPKVRMALENARVPIFYFAPSGNIHDVFDAALRLGKAIGQENRAVQMVQAWQNRLSQLQSRLAGVKPVRLMQVARYPFVAGGKTTFQDICEHVGAINVAEEAGLIGHVPLPVDKAIKWKVDYLIGPREPDMDLLTHLQQTPPYQALSTVKQGKLLQVDSAYFFSNSHYRIEAFEQIAKAIHPERFEVH